MPCDSHHTITIKIQTNENTKQRHSNSLCTVPRNCRIARITRIRGIVLAMRKTPLRRVSKQKQKQNREYGKLREKFMAENPGCKVCEGEGEPNPRRAVDVHHVSGRGSKTNDVSTWLPVCRQCHDDIHFGATRGRGSSWARERGYLD